MTATKYPLLVLCALSILTGSPSQSRADERAVFFENKIRPILADHCFECHGSKRQEADVRLDRKTLAFKETFSGPSIVAGNPEESRIWQVIVYDESDTQMPPEEKLSDEQLSLIRTWIEQGAYWPDDINEGEGDEIEIPRNEDGTIDFVRAAETHWSYRPVQSHPTPENQHPELTRTAIDAWLQSSLEEAGLSFSPAADRETLIRRIYLDLLGVPPTYEDVVEFVNDERPDAVNRLVDRCLASPLYGQRWGRHWLDLARYADTKGYVFVQNRLYPYSYTYRDFVIQAMNDDLPYDEFVKLQIAADKMGFAEDDLRLTAMGFLTVGPRFLNNGHDIIDDRIDVVTRGLMGMTVACARCHDHKYDPIPTADYYSLYGVFNSSYEPPEPPLVGKVDETDPGHQAFLAEMANREKALNDYVEKSHKDLMRQITEYAVDYLPVAAKHMKLIPEETDLQLQHGQPRDRMREHWKNMINNWTTNNHPVFIPWAQLMALTDEQVGDERQAVLTALQENPEIPQPVKEALNASPPQTRLEVARLYGQLFTNVTQEWNQLKAENAEATALADPEKDKLRALLFGEGSLTSIPATEGNPLFEGDQRVDLTNLRARIDEWKAESPNAPPRAMVLLDRNEPLEPVIFLRGDPRRPGPNIPRHFPQILENGEAQPFTNGSGRLELAESIVSKDNPLTARVFVNRVWSYHFGRGIVPTASDFGLRGEPPSHPELLEDLAWRFMHEDQWSLKHLHRKIMTSHAYQQASVNRDDGLEIDPENNLLWRNNRQRLSFESMRDSMLAVTGLLVDDLTGKPVNIETNPFPRRRSVYAMIDRNNPSGMLRTFDFPSSDTSSAGRSLTTVPQQALYSLNSPFAQEISDLVAQSIASESEDHPEQVRLLVKRIYSREPSNEELEAMSAYLQHGTLSDLSQALLMTNEFLFVD